MIKIRLKRIGMKHTPFYRIVVADVRTRAQGKYLEQIGIYDPIHDEIKVDKEIVLKWIAHGAQMTATVKKIFSQEKIIQELHEARLAKNAEVKKSVEDKPVKNVLTKKLTSKVSKKSAPKDSKKTVAADKK